MHERLLGRDLVSALEAAAAVQGLRRVHRAQVAVGTYRSIDLDALMFCFEAAAPGSVAEGAALQIEEHLIAAYCLNCDLDVLVRRRTDVCPRCGGFRLQVRSDPGLTILACEGD